MPNNTCICECCHETYTLEPNCDLTICQACNKKWELDARWEANNEAWREQENDMLQARGFILENDDDDDDPDYCGWLCEVCGDPLYDCGHYVCAHCGTALPYDAVGTHEICSNCEYELEHPIDEIIYDDFSQVHEEFVF